MKKYKVLLSLLCVVVFVFLAVGSAGNDEEPTVEPDELVEEVEEETFPDKQELEQELLNIIRQSFEGTAEVELIEEEETFKITPTDPALSADLIAAYEGDPNALEEWEFLVEAMKGMSANMEPMLPGYWIDFRNPENPENSILVVEDGVVIYDFIDD